MPETGYWIDFTPRRWPHQLSQYSTEAHYGTVMKSYMYLPSIPPLSLSLSPFFFQPLFFLLISHFQVPIFFLPLPAFGHLPVSFSIPHFLCTITLFIFTYLLYLSVFLPYLSVFSPSFSFYHLSLFSISFSFSISLPLVLFPAFFLHLPLFSFIPFALPFSLFTSPLLYTTPFYFLLTFNVSLFLPTSPSFFLHLPLSFYISLSCSASLFLSTSSSIFSSTFFSSFLTFYLPIPLYHSFPFFSHFLLLPLSFILSLSVFPSPISFSISLFRFLFPLLFLRLSTMPQGIKFLLKRGYKNVFTASLRICIARPFPRYCRERFNFRGQISRASNAICMTMKTDQRRLRKRWQGRWLMRIMVGGKSREGGFGEEDDVVDDEDKAGNKVWLVTLMIGDDNDYEEILLSWQQFVQKKIIMTE